MKFDLIYELETPFPWEPDQGEAEYRTYWEALEQIDLADRLGFDTVWMVEHHFREERSHCSAPEVFLGAVSQRTKRIRLGHGVVLLPYPFNHPIRVAERIAVLDILSNGRVEFGTGRSTKFEQEGFRIAAEETRPMWEEALRMIPRMWQTDKFSHQGHYFDIPERNILPKPKQRPHPPIWMATTNEESFPIAGQMGIGAMAMAILLPLAELERRIQVYRRAIAQAEPVGAFVTNQVAGFTIVHCADSNARARENGVYEAVDWWLRRSLELRAKWDGSDTYAKQFAKYPVLQAVAEGRMTVEDFDNEDMVIAGDPEKVIRKIERYERAGVDHLLCYMQVGQIAHENILRSIELIGTEVIPHFRSRVEVNA
jgi:alkanesulfonate monooxygenase SsuD/methylene tetrahydromethanopterin reductase-like flavin-dependent oxidoreductase (luciferase family)